ncbi:MAG: chemotaxis response regulator protein-glutamate methylesterase [Opitutales bacterium]
MGDKGPVRVLIVDDSAVVRRQISRFLEQDPEIEVVGFAADPYQARDEILRLKPDVLTLDIEMPKMDGLTFLGILMKQRPLPVVVISSVSTRGSTVAMEALKLGAVDVLGKPRSSSDIGHLGPLLAQKVKAAARCRLQTHLSATQGPFVRRPVSSHPFNNGNGTDPRQVVLLGASTGGTEAVKGVLADLPATMPGILIVQHIPAFFSKAWAERMDQMSALDVREAVDGDRTRPGLALVAPGDQHMTISWVGGAYRVQLNHGPPVWHQRPAVDVLFRSAVAAKAAPHATAAVFTGMGRDGAEGLLELRKGGARTFTQSADSCVVYGMPKAADDLGASQKSVHLNQMARALRDAVNQPPPAPAT